MTRFEVFVMVGTLACCFASIALIAWMLWVEPADEHDVETTPEETDTWPLIGT